MLCYIEQATKPRVSKVLYRTFSYRLPFFKKSEFIKIINVNLPLISLRKVTPVFHDRMEVLYLFSKSMCSHVFYENFSCTTEILIDIAKAKMKHSAVFIVIFEVYMTYSSKLFKVSVDLQK